MDVMGQTILGLCVLSAQRPSPQYCPMPIRLITVSCPQRMPHYFRRVNEQNWEEKIGTYLVALSKVADKIPKESKIFENTASSKLV